VYGKLRGDNTRRVCGMLWEPEAQRVVIAQDDLRVTVDATFAADTESGRRAAGRSRIGCPRTGTPTRRSAIRGRSTCSGRRQSPPSSSPGARSDGAGSGSAWNRPRGATSELTPASPGAPAWMDG